MFVWQAGIVEHLFGDNDTLLIAFGGFDSAMNQVHQAADSLARELLRTVGGFIRLRLSADESTNYDSSELSPTVIDKCDQATKGMWWMPWHREATKDVVACDMLREAGKRALIRRFLNEETQPW